MVGIVFKWGVYYIYHSAELRAPSENPTYVELRETQVAFVDVHRLDEEAEPTTYFFLFNRKSNAYEKSEDK